MSTGFRLNLSRSFVYHANRETVVLKDALGNTVCTVHDAKRLGGADAEAAPSNGKYLEWQASWRLPEPNVTGTILPGWTITDEAGCVFTILDVAWPRNQLQAWQCFTNRLMFNAQLNDTVQYLQVTITGASAMGARTITHTEVGSPVAAAIEPESNPFGEQFGTKNAGETFMVYLDSDPSGTGPSVIKAGDLIQSQAGTKYEIVDVFSRNRLDMKPTVRAVKKL